MVKPLKILQVLPRLNTGGVERGVIDIAFYINSHRPHHCIIASAGGSLESELARKKISHFTLPLDSKNPFIIALNIFKLEKIIQKQGINVIHARSRAPAWSAYWAAKKCGIPFVTTFHGAYSITSRLKLFYNSVMAKGDKIIAVSKFIESYILHHYQVAPKKIELIQRGVDLKIFNPEIVTEARVETLLKKYRLPFEKKIILLPGRLSRIKGHMVLLDALALLDSDDWICLVVGSIHPQKQEYLQNLYDYATHLKIRHRLYVYNECNDMAALYKMSHVVVCPTIVPEAFGRVIAEAMAMEKPVIATDHGGAQEIIENGINGYLVPPKNPKMLAVALKKVMETSKQDLEKLGLQAHRRINMFFDNNVMVEKTIKLYKNLVK